MLGWAFDGEWRMKENPVDVPAERQSPWLSR